MNEGSERNNSWRAQADSTNLAVRRSMISRPPCLPDTKRRSTKKLCVGEGDERSNRRTSSPIALFDFQRFGEEPQGRCCLKVTEQCVATGKDDVTLEDVCINCLDRKLPQ